MDMLAAHGRSQLGSQLAPYYSRNLRPMAAMISCIDSFVGADCGVMHLAAASGTPTLGLFSVTDPAKYGPYGGANAALDTRGMNAGAVAVTAARWCARLSPRSSPRNVTRDVRAGHGRRWRPWAGCRQRHGCPHRQDAEAVGSMACRPFGWTVVPKRAAER
ncbi:hypothetical protein RLIN73S_06012 [Rhodanobacter lindaniclasticus]